MICAADSQALRSRNSPSRDRHSTPVCWGSVTITVVVCAYNEARLLSACLHSLRAQTRPPDEILVVNNASTDETGVVARTVPGVRVIDEPTKGLVVARETARRASHGDVLAYIDADCRAPIWWLERVAARFERPDAPAAVTGPYRFYDWDWAGRALIRLYDVVVAPPTHAIVHHALGIGAILYGGNFAVSRDALTMIGGFDRSIEFHGEDTNLGRRLTPIGRVDIAGECWVWTSARRYHAMGKRAVFGLYVRNFWSEILRHRPADRDHLDVRA
jgi:glycosyltransferase involved in cell wall biosynthesis